MNPGLPHPLGATVMQDGVNFALAAPHATAVDLCLFDPGTRTAHACPPKSHNATACIQNASGGLLKYGVSGFK